MRTLRADQQQRLSLQAQHKIEVLELELKEVEADPKHTKKWYSFFSKD